MRHLLTILAALLLCAAPAQAQTLKALMYNTTNGAIVYGGTNQLMFTNRVWFNTSTNYTEFNSIWLSDESSIIFDGAGYTVNFPAINFGDAAAAAATRTNLGLGANSIVTFGDIFAANIEAGSGTNSVAFGPLGIDFAGVAAAATRTNLGLGANDSVTFADVVAASFESGGGSNYTRMTADGLEFGHPGLAGASRTNLGLGASSSVTFAGLTNNGDITIANTTASNGLLFIRRTNNEAFLGMANLIASNNTTVSNETLFRVGVAEATNRSAQFGFRATNTNGNGVAVFSVFGFNALMQIGADASTNAVIYSGGGTNNEVMTLIRDGATEFARPLRFSTNASTRPSTNAPANTTNVAAWVEMRIGTNSYRVPLYQ
jgi:hypothetical protein